MTELCDELKITTNLMKVAKNAIIDAYDLGMYENKYSLMPEVYDGMYKQVDKRAKESRTELFNMIKELTDD